jgi:hypothetical protein
VSARFRAIVRWRVPAAGASRAGKAREPGRRDLDLARAIHGTSWLINVVGASVALSSSNGDRSAAPLLVPVVGPFIGIGTNAFGRPNADFGDAGAVVLALDGLVQVAGAAMLIAGIAAPKTILVPIGTAKIELLPTPLTLGKSASGFGLIGKF